MNDRPEKLLGEMWDSRPRLSKRRLKPAATNIFHNLWVGHRPMRNCIGLKYIHSYRVRIKATRSFFS